MTSERLNRIADLVSHWAAATPDSEAIVSEGRRISYEELDELVDTCARALLAGGIRRGDRVAVLCTTRWEAFVLFYGLCRIGAVWVGLNPRHLINELAYVIEDSEPVALFAMDGFETRDYRETVRELADRYGCIESCFSITGSMDGFTPLDAFLSRAPELPEAVYQEAVSEVTPEDCATIIYTSGSTGKPKGGMLPHRGLIAAQAAIGQYELSAWRALNNFPLDHIGGLTDISLQILLRGGTAFLSQRFSARTDLDVIETERISLFFQTVGQCVDYEALPDFWQRDLSSIELILWAGEPTPIGMIHRWDELTDHQASVWGMTETCGGATATLPGTDLESLATCIGVAIPGVESKVIDEQGNQLEPGNPGELCVRGPVLMLGYLNRPEATAEAVDDEGWLHTGDLVEERSDGNLVFVGRKKHMFKSGGYNVYPREIEMTLEGQAGVALAAVVDAPHPKFNQVGVAFVTADHGAALREETLEQYCRGELANYKIPKRFIIRDELPLLPSGKIDRRSLAAEVQSPFVDKREQTLT